MPMPKFMGQVNKRLFNPREIAKGKRPVLTHKGRTSGRLHHTPLEAFPVDGGYVITIIYGSDCDWAQNVLAAGEAELRFKGSDYTLTSPRLIDKAEARELLPASHDFPPSFMKVTEFLMAEASAK